MSQVIEAYYIPAPFLKTLITVEKNNFFPCHKILMEYESHYSLFTSMSQFTSLSVGRT
jgi:hypothetical protein